MLDVARLQALLAKTSDVGLDVGRGKEPVALVRLRLAKALIGVAEANALAAESIAIERGVSTGQRTRWHPHAPVEHTGQAPMSENCCIVLFRLAVRHQPRGARRAMDVTTPAGARLSGQRVFGGAFEDGCTCRGVTPTRALGSLGCTTQLELLGDRLDDPGPPRQCDLAARYGLEGVLSDLAIDFSEPLDRVELNVA